MAAKKKPLESKPAQLGAVRVTVTEDGAARRASGGTHHRRGRGGGPRARAAAPDRGEGALMANVLVYAETRDGELRKIALEAVTAARALADASGGGEVHALLAGAAGIGAKARAARQARRRRRARGGERGLRAVRARVARGHDRGSGEGGRLPRRRARLLARRGATSGRASPRGSMRRSRRDVTAIAVSGDTITVKHPGYANKVIMTLALTGSPVVLSVRPSAVHRGRIAEGGARGERSRRRRRRAPP